MTVQYFKQNLEWEEKAATPMQIVSNHFPALCSREVRKHLARCGISSKHAMQPIHTLSGGEQSKVKLCILTLSPCNFLIMDEPANHLDTLAKEALQQAFLKFPGTLLLVSHEEAFYKDWAEIIINIETIRKNGQSSPSQQPPDSDT